ncbi:MAG TPA: nitroreductase family protein [Salinivirgaceae bacterium]|nr:nitroreductase family protein [Salinivirgaceae bacterium]
MDFNDVILQRRSVREFLPKPLTTEQIAELKETILKVPSAKAIFPWRIYFITNKQKIEQLAKLKPTGASFIQEAPLVVLVAADSSLSDMWIEDCSIAATYLLLKAVDLGLGACWVQVRNRQHDDRISARRYILQTMDLPESFGICCLIAIGYPRETDEDPSTYRRDLSYKIVDIQ